MHFPSGPGAWYDPRAQEEYFIDDVLPRGETIRDAIRWGTPDPLDEGDPLIRPEWWAATGRSRLVYRTTGDDETRTLCGQRLRGPRAVNPYVGNWIACDACLDTSAP
jgi:hypothetical protein